MRVRVIKGFYDHESHEIKEKYSLLTVSKERGQELKALGLIAEVEEEKGKLDPGQFDEYSYQELKKLAADMGLSTSGKKEDLIERISSVEVGYTPMTDEEVEKLALDDEEPKDETDLDDEEPKVE